MTKDVNPWELIPDKTISQLVFAYEMVLTEMRTHGRANKTIRAWVERLDSERDEFAVAMSARGAPPDEPRDEWQPIATAPKDGMHVLAYFDHDPVYRSDEPSDRMAVVRWSGEYTGWCMPGIGGLSPVLWKPLVRPVVNRP